MDKLGGLVFMLCSMWSGNPDSFKKPQCWDTMHRGFYTDRILFW